MSAVQSAPQNRGVERGHRNPTVVTLCELAVALGVESILLAGTPKIVLQQYHPIPYLKLIDGRKAALHQTTLHVLR
jgi:hypothetical protein